MLKINTKVLMTISFNTNIKCVFTMYNIHRKDISWEYIFSQNILFLIIHFLSLWVTDFSNAEKNWCRKSKLFKAVTFLLHFSCLHVIYQFISLDCTFIKSVPLLFTLCNESIVSMHSPPTGANKLVRTQFP